MDNQEVRDKRDLENFEKFGLWPVWRPPSAALLAAKEEEERRVHAKYRSKFSDRTWQIAAYLKWRHDQESPDRPEHVDVCQERNGEWYLSIWCYRPSRFIRLSDEGDKTRMKFCKSHVEPVDWDNLETKDLGLFTNGEEAWRAWVG